VGKATTYILVMSGLMLLFYYTGLLDQTASLNSALLDLLFDIEGLGSGDTTTPSVNAWKVVVLALEGILAAAVIVVGFFRNSPELFIVAPIAIYMANLLLDFVIVFNVIASVTPVLATLVFAPIMLLFMFTVVEWWRGRD